MSTNGSLPSSHHNEPDEQFDEHDHDLIVVTEFLPGREPTDYGIDLTEGPPHEYETKYWRCRKCGQERNFRSEFLEPCEAINPVSPISVGGYSIEDARTRRALSEQMEVRFGTRGGPYRVISESGNSYEVDVESTVCTCPDHTTRQVECKHLRRVQLEILSGQIPAQDGKFRRR